MFFFLGVEESKDQAHYTIVFMQRMKKKIPKPKQYSASVKPV